MMLVDIRNSPSRRRITCTSVSSMRFSRLEPKQASVVKGQCEAYIQLKECTKRLSKAMTGK